VEDVKHPHSCTILLKGPNDYTIAQLKDAVRDGMHAVMNAIEDAAIVPGGGAFELAAASDLVEYAHKEVTGKTKLGVLAFAEALLVVPKTLAENSGFDISVRRRPRPAMRTSVRHLPLLLTLLAPQETLIKLQEERARTGAAVGLDVYTGAPFLPELTGIWDCYRVKRQFLTLSTILAAQLLLVDEVLRAGRGTRGGN